MYLNAVPNNNVISTSIEQCAFNYTAQMRNSIQTVRVAKIFDWFLVN